MDTKILKKEFGKDLIFWEPLLIRKVYYLLVLLKKLGMKLKEE